MDRNYPGHLGHDKGVPANENELDDEEDDDFVPDEQKEERTRLSGICEGEWR
jgi:hypothetical protein